MSAVDKIIINKYNGVLCTTSINIAEVTDKLHKNVIKDIERLNAYLEAQIGSQPGGYFIESTYLDANGQARKMYYLTKKGTAWLINRYTGESAVEFQLAYIEKFEEMEKALESLDPLELVILSAQRQLELKREQERHALLIQQTNNRVTEVEEKLIDLKKEVNANSSYVTVMGFANLRNIKINENKASQLGKEATRACKYADVNVGKTRHEKWGGVNTYPEDILQKVFETYNLI